MVVAITARRSTISTHECRQDDDDAADVVDEEDYDVDDDDVGDGDDHDAGDDDCGDDDGPGV
eukprot:1573842-Pyramimonas_sp.AAC.1